MKKLRDATEQEWKNVFTNIGLIFIHLERYIDDENDQDSLTINYTDKGFESLGLWLKIDFKNHTCFSVDSFPWFRLAIELNNRGYLSSHQIHSKKLTIDSKGIGIFKTLKNGSEIPISEEEYNSLKEDQIFKLF